MVDGVTNEGAVAYIRSATSSQGGAVAYLRVSTDQQHLGPEAQREQIEAWASARGVTVLSWHSDLGVSGAAPVERCPGLMAAIDALEKQRAECLVVARRDRLARDVMRAAIVERLVEQRGARVVSAAGEGSDADPADPGGKLTRQIIDAFAEFERALIVSRIRAALAVRRAKGLRCGGIPYGMRLAEDGEHVEIDPHEMGVLDEMVLLRSGGANPAEIARTVNERGWRTRAGGRWTADRVRRLLARRGQP